MSPSSSGYFLHVVTGEILPIHDHAVDAWSKPNDLGLEHDSLSDLNPMQDRIDILERVLSKGWIRIRHIKEFVSIEFLTEWEATIESFASSVEELGIGDSCFVHARQLAIGGSLGCHVYELKGHSQDGTISDLLDRIVVG